MFDDLFCCNSLYYFSYIGQVANRPVVFLYKFQVHFLSSGLMKASLKDGDGNIPFLSNEFTPAVISGESWGIISFSISVGMGSNSQLLDGVTSTAFIMS